jgi:DNA replication protein DnaC
MKDEQRHRQELAILLRSLHLPTITALYQDTASRAAREGWTFEQYLHNLVEQEVQDRGRRKVERMMKQSGLPVYKTLDTLQLKHLPVAVQRQLPALCEGHFVDEATNILAFGLPGRGKTHVLCAIGHALVRQGRKVLFLPAFKLVHRLLKAKKDLLLDKELRKLDTFDAVIIDDIGYVQQSREEMEVLFTFLAERYERKSVLISSNLVFSQWDKIFKDPMTTAAAIDRLVHHSVILELTGNSFRAMAAGLNPANKEAKS